MLTLSYPSHPPSPLLQHHNGYIYATSHANIVKSIIRVHASGYVVVGDGFEVAPGDASDIEVTNAYPWGCLKLFFSDNHMALTALYLKTGTYPGDPQPGMARFVVEQIPLL
jgi:hypothetical protein